LAEENLMSNRAPQSLQFEGLELRTMMAVDMPRLIAPAASVTVLHAAPTRGARDAANVQGEHNSGPSGGGNGNSGGNGNGNGGGGQIVVDRALLRAIVTAALELRLIDGAMHPLLRRITDKTEPGIAAQLTRIQTAADHIADTVAAALPDGTEVVVVVAAGNTNGGPGDADSPIDIPPAGELLERALTLLADRMERVDRRLTDALDGVDATTLSPRVLDQLERIQDSATHISDDIAALPETPVTPPSPEERRLVAVVEQLEVAETVLTRSLNELGAAGQSLPPLVQRFLDNIDQEADSLDTQIETVLAAEGEPGASAKAAAADHGNTRPRPILAIPGLAIVNAAVVRADQEVRRIIERLAGDVSEGVKRVLAEIAEHAQAIGDQVAPYTDEGDPTEPSEPAGE
jgi:hypothetical protein